MASQRQPIFDVLKGIAIFMVVMGHVLAICVRGIDRATLFKLLGEGHMPLFFFISGYFCFKRLPDGAVAVPDYGKRVLQLIVPMVVVSTAWIYYFPVSGLESPFISDWGGLWGDASKNGYWFTPVLFVLMLIYCLSIPVLHRVRGAAWQALFVLAVWAAMLVGYEFVSAQVSSALSLIFIVRFFPVFMFGAIARDHKEAFARFYHSSWAMTIGLPLGVLILSYVGWFWRYPFMPSWSLEPCRSLLHLCIVAVGFSAVRGWAPEGAATRLWSYLGRKSLAIYLLHYFLLFPMGFCRGWLESMDLANLPLAVFSAAVAACVIAGVLVICALIDRSPLLSLLLTGTLINTNKTPEAPATGLSR